MSDPVADLFRRAEGTTMVQARPIESVLPRRRESGRAPHGTRRLVGVVAAVSLVVAGTGLLVTGTVGRGGVRTITPAVPTALPTVSLPTGSPGPATSSVAGAATALPGFLRPADLGAGRWSLDAADIQAGAVSPQLVTCAGEVALQSLTGPAQMYRGVTTEGGEWLLTETVIPLDSASLAQARTLLQAMTTCPDSFNQVLLAVGDQIVVFGRLQPSGAVGEATSYALVGNRYLQLDTLPGGAVGNLDLPGQTQWLIDVTARAVTRATGITPSKPAPNPRAKAAAARYHTDPAAVVYAPGTADPGAQPSWQPSPSNVAPRGDLLLSADALSAATDWAVVEPSDSAPLGGIPAIPSCSGPPLTIDAPASGRAFRLTPLHGGSTGTWTVVAQVAELPGGGSALAAARIVDNGCTSSDSLQWLHLPGPAVAAVAQTSGGAFARLTLWSVVGNRIVSVGVYPDSGPAANAQVQDAQWLAAVADAARRAAG